MFDDTCRYIWLLKVIQKATVQKMLAIKLKFFTRAWLSRRKKKSGQKEDVNWYFEGRKYFLSSTDTRCGGSCENNTSPTQGIPNTRELSHMIYFYISINGKYSVAFEDFPEKHICDLIIRKTKIHIQRI